MSEEHPDTKEMRVVQSRREAEEKERAQSSADDEETAQHERRADKARYLKEKLEQRAESERDAGS